MPFIITPSFFFCVISCLRHVPSGLVFNFMLSTVWHSKYIIVLISYQYHSIITINYRHRYSSNTKINSNIFFITSGYGRLDNAYNHDIKDNHVIDGCKRPDSWGSKLCHTQYCVIQLGYQLMWSDLSQPLIIWGSLMIDHTPMGETLKGIPYLAIFQ